MTRDEIMRESKAEGGMFIVIPSVVQLDTELPLSARMLYGVITWRCNNYAYTWRTNRELGEDLGVSPKRVSALLSLLEERGHIETEIEYKDGTHEIVRRYIYPIMRSAKSMGRRGPLPKNKDTPPPENGYTLPSGTGIPLPENEEVICNINKQKRNKKDSPYSPPGQPQAAGTVVGQSPMTSPDSPSADSDPVDKLAPRSRRTRPGKSMPVHDPDAFEKLWEIYPRKDSRKATIRAWDKLKPDRALCRVMYTAIKRQRRSEQWNEANGKFIPMFSTWLNGRRWENEGVDLSLLDRPREPMEPIGGWLPDPEAPS